MLQGAASSDCGCKLLHSSRLVIKMFTVERDYLKTQPFVQFGSLMMQISAASSLPLACVLLSTYSDITHCFVVSFLKPRVQPSPRWAAGSHVSFIPYFTLNWTIIIRETSVLNKRQYRKKILFKSVVHYFKPCSQKLLYLHRTVVKSCIHTSLATPITNIIHWYRF